MPEYNNSSIYKLCCRIPIIKDFYVGSTTNFTRRKHQHKACATNYKNKNYNMPVYQFIRATGGWHNWDMVEIEKFSAKDKLELCKREREVMEELEPQLNRRLAYCSEEEHKAKHLANVKQWQSKNRDKVQEMRKKYRENHKAEINKYKKEKVVCECGLELSRNHVARHRKSKIHQEWEKSIPQNTN